MKNIKNLIAIVLVVFTFNNAFAQEFEKYFTVTAFGGIQNPMEFALIDLNGNVPKERFSPGLMTGVELGAEWKRISLTFQSSYMHNTLTHESIIEGQNTNMHTLNFNSKFWLSLLKPDSKFRLKIGAGFGLPISKLPEQKFRFYDNVYDQGFEEYTSPAETTTTVTLSSGVSLIYAINKTFSIYSAFSNDMSVLYADLEPAIITSANVGLTYRIYK